MEHDWRMIMFCHIEVLPNMKGDPIVVLDPDKFQEAQDKATYGCFRCNLPLEGNFGTPCEVKVD